MVLSLSHTFDSSRRAGVARSARARVNAKSEPSARHAERPTTRRIELDLRGPGGITQLRRTNVFWPRLSDAERHAWLDSRDIILPPRATPENGPALLPGGAVALRCPEGMLICDPVEAALFSQAEVKQLRRALRTRSDVCTLMHTSGGVMRRQRVPKHLPPQAVTIVPNTSCLPIRVPFSGPALIQWGLHGAVARPLIAAPALFALAVSIAASAHDVEELGSFRHDPVIEAETWQARDADDRRRLIAAALTDHLTDLFAGTVCEELRRALTEACVSGPGSLADRMARALAVPPTSFAADPGSLPGSPPYAWRHAMAHIRASKHPRALLGLDHLGDPLSAMNGLRDTLVHAELMAFNEDGAPVVGGAVSLHGDAAQLLVRKAGPYGRLAVAMPAPVSPVDLYVLAQEMALMSKGRVIAVAPNWGFCHSVGSDGTESGNAGWFGMGAGLDDVDGAAEEFAPSA